MSILVAYHPVGMAAGFSVDCVPMHSTASLGRLILVVSPLDPTDDAPADLDDTRFVEAQSLQCATGPRRDLPPPPTR